MTDTVDNKVNHQVNDDGRPVIVQHDDMWYQRLWRPAGAAVYFALCIMDYIIRPLLNSALKKDFSLANTVSDVTNLDPAVQVRAMELASSVGTIEPILHEYVHLSFAAILGAGAWTRGQEKINRMRSPYTPGQRQSDYTGGRK